MPYQWIDPELFLEHQGVAVYYAYEDGGNACYYWYTTDPSDDDWTWSEPDSDQFDVRDLPNLGLDVQNRANHAQIIRQAISQGLITGEPALAKPPLTVKIEVRGGLAYLVEQPPGVEVEIINLTEDKEPRERR